MKNSKTKVLLSHPTGNANVRGILTGLHKHDMLHSFHTCIACFEGSMLDKLASFPPFKDFRKRRFSTDICYKTTTYPFMEMGRMFSQKFKLNHCLTHEKGCFCIDKVYRQFDKQVSKYLVQQHNISAVYCYEDGALETFKQAKKTGVKCIYDLPTGYWKAARDILCEDLEKYPLWKDTFTGFKDSEEKLMRKDMELQHSDMIYVASRFTANSIKKYAGTLPAVQIIPYGFPPANEPKLLPDRKKIKFLFVGKLSQQKGIADVFEALRGLEKYVELTLIGSKSNSKILEQELRNHNYIGTLPHNQVLSVMREHDVLLFPSLFDGFGMVMTEAMSQGTPVIASERSAGPDIIEHGKNGWLMQAGSVMSLRENIENILSSPQIIESVGFQAIQTAKQRPWSQYGLEMAKSIQQFLNN